MRCQHKADDEEERKTKHPRYIRNVDDVPYNEKSKQCPDIPVQYNLDSGMQSRPPTVVCTYVQYC